MQKAISLDGCFASDGAQGRVILLMFSKVGVFLNSFPFKQPKSAVLFVYLLFTVYPLAGCLFAASLFLFFPTFQILYFKGTSCSCLHHVLPVSVVGNRTITEIA